MSDICLQLKGSVITAFILELYHYTASEFTQQLEDKINQAPAFFEQSPVVISLDKFEIAPDENTRGGNVRGENTPVEIDLLELVSICQQYNLQPMAFRCADARFIPAIKKTGLVHLPVNVSRPSIKQAAQQTASSDIQTPAVQNADSERAVSDPLPGTQHNTQSDSAVSRKSKIISRPVRSGQQVYAEGADLIILSQVSEGAEVLADGNIHVYGTLRGRALAGVKGDTSARVFCKRLEAELVSIAGHFMLSDSLREKVWAQSAQVFLDQQTLQVEAV